MSLARSSRRSRAISTVPETSVLGNIGNLIKWRGRGTASWNREALSASLFTELRGRTT